MKKIILGLFLGILITHSAYAFNLDFLSYSSVYYFTKEDWMLSEKAAQDALNRARDNTKVNWSNPQTGAHGYFMPVKTVIKNGTKCRQMKMVSEAHKVTGQSVYWFCYMNGDWVTQ